MTIKDELDATQANTTQIITALVALTQAVAGIGKTVADLTTAVASIPGSTGESPDAGALNKSIAELGTKLDQVVAATTDLQGQLETTTPVPPAPQPEPAPESASDSAPSA